MIDPLLQLIIAVSLSLLFISAASHKRSDRHRFAAQLEAYELLPKSFAAPVAAALPWFELAAGLLLLIPASRPIAGVVACGLLVIYAMAILVNLLRGRHDIDCGCGGTAQPLSYWLVLRNGSMALTALAIVLPATPRALHLDDALAMVAMTALLGLCYLIVGQLIHNQNALQGGSQHEQ
ncbi:MAG: MauE/DoxX family redox-associated membrane protein [Congregibacter sp.]